MDISYWQKQEAIKPLFEDLVWSKPQQKALAGKLLIIGGNLHAISAPSEAFAEAIKQGVGECQVVMPSATKKLLGPKPPAEIHFTPSTNSGSFASEAIGELTTYTSWSNAVLLAGDFGHSSETAIIIEKLSKLPSLQIYTGDAIDCLINQPDLLLKRANTALVLDFAQLQKLAMHSEHPKALTTGMNLMQLVDFLHEFTKLYVSNIVVSYSGQIIIACDSKVVSTKIEPLNKHWNAKYASAIAVWWLQNPTKPLQAIATATIQTK